MTHGDDDLPQIEDSQLHASRPNELAERQQPRFRSFANVARV